MKYLLCSLLSFISISAYCASASAPEPEPAPVPQNHFSKNIVSLGFYQDSLDPKITRPPRPIIWTATAKVDHGMTFLYERNIFHTKKYLSINVGTSGSWWQRQKQSIFALSGFLTFRIWPFHTQYFSPYILYSVAGPTLLSRDHLNGIDLGGHFTWQDFFGVGAQIGNNGYIEAKLQHYSNGDVLAVNPGFDVPIVIALGYGF